jgi:hypothetical protein
MIKLEELKNMAAALTEIRRVDEKKMDKVDKDAVKGDFDDREDKDIDNDGDVDASDRYLHNRRKTVTKAVTKDTEESKDYGPGHIGAIQKMLDKERETKKSKGSVKKESTELDEDMNALTTAAAMAPAAALAASGLLYKGYGKSKRSVMDRIADTKDAKKRHKDSIKQADKYLSKSTNPKTLDKYKKQKDYSQNKLKQSSYIKSLSRKEEVELDEAKDDISKMNDRDLGAMIDKLKRQLNRIQNPEAKKKIRIDIEKYEDEKKRRNLDEKAESEAQAIAARIALKHKREGTKPEPGTASAEMMKMSEKDLKDFTKMKKGAPYKVEESTDLTEDAWKEIPMMKRQLQFIKYAAGEIIEYMNITADPEEWFQNKLAHVHDQMQSLHAYIEGDKRMMAMEATDLNEDITKMSHGRLKWHMNTGVPHGSYTNDEMKKERDRRLKNRDSADAYKKAKAGLSENFMEATGLDEANDPKMKSAMQKYVTDFFASLSPAEREKVMKSFYADQQATTKAIFDVMSKVAKSRGLKESTFDEATDAEIRAKQTAGATKPEGIADKESEGSKKFMMMHTTQVPDEVNSDEINRMNAEEIKASLQRKVSYRWNDQKIGDK